MDDLKAEMELCEKDAFLLAPMLIAISLADSSGISNLDEMFENGADESTHHDFITDLNDASQLKYIERLNDVIDDLIEMGYYQTDFV